MCIDLRRRKKQSQAINPAHQGAEEEQNSEDEEPTTPRPKRTTSKESQQALNDGVSELNSSDDPDWEMDIINENDKAGDDLDGSEMMDVDLDSDVPRTSKSAAAGKANKAKPQSTTKTGEQKEKGKQGDIRSAVMAGRQKKPSAVRYNNFPMTVLFVDEI